MKVLDVGCGIDGRSFSDHVDSSWLITGLDVHHPSRVRHEHPNFKYLPGDARNMQDLADKSFDLVVSFGMLEHITAPQDYEAVCRELQRVAV